MIFVTMNPWILSLLILFNLQPTNPVSSHEGPTVRHFEQVRYNPLSHQLHKRSTDNSWTVELHSHGRTFKLLLTPDQTTMAPHIYIENSDGQFGGTDHSPVTGRIQGDDGSRVTGLLSTEGTFEGVLITGAGTEFYVEPTQRYWSDDILHGESVMYRAEDVLIPPGTHCQSHILADLRKGNESRVPLKQFQLKRRREKRWLIDQRKKTCMLFLQADYNFFSRFGSEEAAINVMTGHIQRLNDIYRQTDFNQDGEADDIQFMIKRIKVHTKNSTLDPKYPYDGQFEVIKFLELFSEGDYDSFCLAYLFTYRDFEGGTLGLAWTGDLKNAGGVCEKKGHFRGGIKSLNTGIITLLNYGKLVAPAVSHVTLAHEVGHNFGSPHDPDQDKSCTPGGDDGNFIMFARATAGDRRNNNKFSACSLKSMNPVLSVKARDTYGCFQEPQKSICGNGVVEEGEECDCGWEEDCPESCCFPMRRLAWTGTSAGTPCRLKPHAHCSPSQGPCCTHACTLTTGNKCRQDNGCRSTAYCDGLRPQCPPSHFKPNRTVCDKNSHVCFMGECTGSICLAFGLESCQCSQQSLDRNTKLCEVCCRHSPHTECISSFDWNESPYDLPSVLAKPGTPCRNFTGYCDTLHTCREVDPSGPLATLRKLLSADEGLATIVEWIDDHWYVVICVLALLLLLMVLSFRVRRKQRLRRLTVLHSNVQAIQIQRSYLEDAEGQRGVVYPTAIRTKIPFKRKVRERRTKPKDNKRRRKSGKVGDSRRGKRQQGTGVEVQTATAATQQDRKVRKSGKGSRRATAQASPKDGVRRSPTAPRRNLQVIYRPPFSVKVEFVPAESKVNKKPSDRVSSQTQNERTKSVRGKPKCRTVRKPSSGGRKLEKTRKSELEILIPKGHEEEEGGSPSQVPPSSTQSGPK